MEKGIIVPCPNSPVRTPIFPVQKVRDAGQPTEWRFVQDLQAVNAAVQVRAPNVPNPYTILSQIPADGQWFSVVDISNASFSFLSILIASFGLLLHLRGTARAPRFTTLHCIVHYRNLCWMMMLLYCSTWMTSWWRHRLSSRAQTTPYVCSLIYLRRATRSTPRRYSALSRK